MTTMKVIGLTGGIGSGKSHVLNLYKELLDVPTLDLDKVAKQVVDENPDVIQAITNAFGNVYENNVLNRKLLADRAFIDKTETQKLNDIVHPAVRQQASKWIKNQANVPYCIVESALMIESGFYTLTDAIIGVFCNKKDRIQRVMKRNSCTKKDVLQRMNLQMPESQKKKYYTYTIRNENSTTIRDIQSAIYDIDRKIKDLVVYPI
jgi:dephospho-CoA kinase